MIHFTLQRYNFFSIRVTFATRFYFPPHSSLVTRHYSLKKPPRWRVSCSSYATTPPQAKGQLWKKYFLPSVYCLLTTNN